MESRKKQHGLPQRKDIEQAIHGVMKWMAFEMGIMLASRSDIRFDDVLMYFTAFIAAIHSIFQNKKDPQFALHALLATIHNLRGHRKLPYIDPVIGYHCHPDLLPTEDVIYHACMLA